MKQKIKLILYMLVFTTNFLNTKDSCSNSTSSNCNSSSDCYSGNSTSCNPSSMDCCLEPYDNREYHSSDKCTKCCSFRCYCCGTTTFIPRSQGANTARYLTGWQKSIYKPFLYQNYVAFMATFEYTDSFKADKLAKRLFCTDCLTFAGSQVKDRNQTKDIVADYFGLPTDYISTLSIKPDIKNYILDLDIYLGPGDLSSGLYFIMHIPITYTRWTLGLDNCLPCQKFAGEPRFPKCYMFSDTKYVPFTNDTSATEYCQCHLYVTNDIIVPEGCTDYPNCTTYSIREALSGNFLFGDMTERWKFGKFSFCPLSKAGVADLDLIMGYNLWQSDCGHFAPFIQVVVPTGNRPNGKHIFQPIVGNGKHWELGGGITTHLSVFSDYNDRSLNLSCYIEGNISYVFKNEQIRAFDFCKNGLLSRYILLKEYNYKGDYIGRMINAINYNTRNCQVSLGYKVDYSIKFVFEYNCITLDLGYNIYAKAGEKVCIKTECPCDIDLRRFGIKGTEGVCCAQYDISDGELISTGIETKLNTTQGNANMFDAISATSTAIPKNQSSVCLTYNNNAIETGEPIVINNKDFFIAKPNLAPEFISCRDLDPNSAAQCRMLTNKFFSYLGYTWISKCYDPHFGAGMEIEFDGTDLNSSLNQWGFWIKMGADF